ncbi:hypothetical protein [Clostridium sp. BNL1100]|uniref:hypothetical protein n=1 Tax=Clostridium sp. BNL1100 TaxID=755731 RepID=UPI00024A78E3|nr:hypothetical protein [Clostridium sp. BNL1100]AEY64855.1 hypothetical protein Clo1100_0578 [Clostridium sp. BNL1100]
MKNAIRNLLTLTVIFAVMCSFVTSAASYPSPAATYDIYNLVRNSSLSAGCSKMVPQGITFAGDYLLISACCEETTKHNSVIYVFNESDKSYFGTIKLPGTAHVGGVAYDCDRSGNIWVSNGNAVGCFKYSKLAECKNTVLSISYNRVANLSYQASTMCYDAVNNYLWIAQFDNTNQDNSFARCYAVEGKTSTSPTLPYQFQISVPLKTQGISVRGDRMMISSSYGRTNDSKLYSYTWNQSTKIPTLKSTTTLPPLSEGVVMGTTYAYIVYESVSPVYYNQPDDNGNYCTYPVRYFAAYNISNFGI